MRDWKMWHKHAGRENAGKENTAQEILAWKMRDNSVWKANRRFLCNIKWIIVYWQNKKKHVVHILEQLSKTYKALNICDPNFVIAGPKRKGRHTPGLLTAAL